jgi:signal transduction histidine kinase
MILGCHFLLSQNSNTAKADSLLQKLQTTSDNKIKTDIYNSLFAVYRNVDTEKANYYANQQWEMAKKINDKDKIAQSLRNKGIIQTNLGNYDTAIELYKQALAENPIPATKAMIYGSLGRAHFLKGDNAISLEYSFKSLSIFENLKDKKSIANQLNNIASNYIALGDNNNARIYMTKAKEALEEKTEQNAALPIDNKTPIHQINHTLNTELPGDFDTNKAEIYLKKGTILSNQKKWKEAENNIQKSILEAKKLGYTNKVALAITILGDLYLKIFNENQDKKTLEKAKENYTKALEIYNQINDKQSISINLKKLSDVEQKLGNIKKALEYNNKYSVYRDSIFNDKTKNTITHIEDQREIELKNRQIKINKLELEAKEKQKWFYISGIFLLVIIASLLFHQSYNRKKNNQKLRQLNSQLEEANRIKTRFFGILNHDLRSPVANLIHFLHLQKENPEMLNQETKERLQNKTISGAENLLSSMEDILLWSKGQMENFKPQPKKITVEQLFEDNKKVFSGYHHITFEYHNPENIEIFTDENYLKTILRNLTSNSINVFSTTENPTIIWKAWQEKNKTYLSITDNGPGSEKEKFRALYDETEVVGIKSGLGLHLIRDLAKAINCEISVNSIQNEGTTFVISI